METMETEEQALLRELKHSFGYREFISADQTKATKEVLKGKNDVLINLQPGAGKSICFQLPAILNRNSVTVVYVPTNAMGENHVDLLRRKNITAEYLCPRTRKKLSTTILKDFSCHATKLKFLYVSIDTDISSYVEDLISSLVTQNALSFLVFDEAHCISRLSHDYLPAYNEVANRVACKFPEIRKIALTGTATREIIGNIIQTLAMDDVKLIRSKSVWSVCQDIRFIDTLQNPFEDLANFIKKCFRSLENGSANDAPQCGIVFCRKKDAAKKLERELCALQIPVVSYHGDLSLEARRSVYDRWIVGEIPVIATTQKFGLGLRGPNVRFVVHWGMPLSIQQLCQETGRCVQDGWRTSSRIYFSIEEVDNIRTHLKSLLAGPKNDVELSARKYRLFNEFVSYCFEKKCRVTTQLAYFDQHTSRCCSTCDACRDPKGLHHRVDQFSELFSKSRQTMRRQRECKQTQGPQTAPTNRSNCSNSSQRRTQPFKSSLQPRERSYKRLLFELRNNYSKNQTDVQKSIKLKDVSEIARTLEYSLFMGASCRRKYNHDVVAAIHNIRKCQRAQLACGYIKYHEEMETFERRECREIIDLVDSDSGSETA